MDRSTYIYRSNISHESEREEANENKILDGQNHRKSNGCSVARKGTSGGQTKACWPKQDNSHLRCSPFSNLCVQVKWLISCTFAINHSSERSVSEIDGYTIRVAHGGMLATTPSDHPRRRVCALLGALRPTRPAHASLLTPLLAHLFWSQHTCELQREAARLWEGCELEYDASGTSKCVPHISKSSHSLTICSASVNATQLNNLLCTIKCIPHNARAYQSHTA